LIKNGELKDLLGKDVPVSQSRKQTVSPSGKAEVMGETEDSSDIPSTFQTIYEDPPPNITYTNSEIGFGPHDCQQNDNTHTNAFKQKI